MRNSTIFGNSPTVLRGRAAPVLLPVIFWKLQRGVAHMSIAVGLNGNRGCCYGLYLAITFYYASIEYPSVTCELIVAYRYKGRNDRELRYGSVHDCSRGAQNI